MGGFPEVDPYLAYLYPTSCHQAKNLIQCEPLLINRDLFFVVFRYGSRKNRTFKRQNQSPAQII
jgi:hypothetical protein